MTTVRGVQITDLVVRRLRAHHVGDTQVDLRRILDLMSPNIPSPATPQERDVCSSDYLEVHTTEQVTGLYGPLRGVQSYILASHIKRAVVGMDPSDSAGMHRAIVGSVLPGHQHQFQIALGALDCALWDVRAKLSGCSLHQLLGGRVRSHLPCYASLLRFDLGAVDAVSVAKAVRDAGFIGQKWAIRKPRTDSPSGIPQLLNDLERIREVVGPDHLLMIDALGVWSSDYATDFARCCEGLNLLWIEEPLRPGMVSSYRDLRRSCRVAIAAGEHIINEIDAIEHLQNNALDFLQIDVGWCGLTLSTNISALAKAHQIPFVPHGAGLIPAAHMAACSDAACIPMMEFHITAQPVEQYFLKDKMIPHLGQIEVTDAVGLSMEIDWGRVSDARVLRWIE